MTFVIDVLQGGVQATPVTRRHLPPLTLHGETENGRGRKPLSPLEEIPVKHSAESLRNRPDPLPLLDITNTDDMKRSEPTPRATRTLHRNFSSGAITARPIRNIVPTPDHHILRPPTADQALKASCHRGVPQIQEHYIPRHNDVRNVLQMLKRAGDSGMAAMCAGAGSGKTVLATMVAHDSAVRVWFEAGVLWLNAYEVCGTFVEL